MANDENWVSEWMKQTEELEASAYEASLQTARERAMERKELLIALSKLLGELKDIEDSLWKTWR